MLVRLIWKKKSNDRWYLTCRYVLATSKSHSWGSSVCMSIAFSLSLPSFLPCWTLRSFFLYQSASFAKKFSLKSLCKSPSILYKGDSCMYCNWWWRLFLQSKENSIDFTFLLRYLHYGLCSQVFLNCKACGIDFACLMRVSSGSQGRCWLHANLV